MRKSEMATIGKSGQKAVFRADGPSCRSVKPVLAEAVEGQGRDLECRLVPMDEEVSETVGQEKILVLLEQTNAEIAGLVLAKRKKDVEEEDDLDDEEDDDLDEDEDEDEDFDEEEDEDEFEEEFEDDELDDDDDDIFYDDDDDE